MDAENKKYIAAKLKSIVEPMVTQLLMHKPDDVPRFMLDWLKTTYNRPAPEVQRTEEEGKKDEVLKTPDASRTRKRQRTST